MICGKGNKLIHIKDFLILLKACPNKTRNLSGLAQTMLRAVQSRQFTSPNIPIHLVRKTATKVQDPEKIVEWVTQDQSCPVRYSTSQSVPTKINNNTNLMLKFLPFPLPTQTNKNQTHSTPP